MSPSKIALALAACVSCLALADRAEAQSLRTSIHYPEGHAVVEAARRLSEELSAATGGELSLDIYPNSALGGLNEGIDQVRAGLNAVDMSGPEIYGTTIPAMNILSLPFIAANSTQARCLLDTALGAYLEGKVEDSGLKVLGWWVNGERHVTNSKLPITKAADFAGMRIRVPPNPIYLETFRLLGANSQVVDATELYQALQQGVIDAQETSYTNIQQRKFNEIQKFLSNSAHFFGFSWFLMNKDTFDALPAERQAALVAAVDRITPEQWALADRKNAQALADLQTSGMTYTQIAPEEIETIRTMVRPLYDSVRAQVGDEGMDLLEAGMASCRT